MSHDRKSQVEAMEEKSGACLREEEPYGDSVHLPEAITASQMRAKAGDMLLPFHMDGSLIHLLSWKMKPGRGRRNFECHWM